MTSTMDILISTGRVRGFVVSPDRSGLIRVSCMVEHDKWLRAVAGDVEHAVREIERQLDHEEPGPRMPDLDTPLDHDLVTRMPGF